MKAGTKAFNTYGQDVTDTEPQDGDLGEQANACRQLWCDVILVAFADVVGADRLARLSAESWFDSNSRNFRDVCAMAGVDPVAVRRHYLEIREARDAENV